MSKNQVELETDLKKLKGLVKEVHLDVVDGVFAPNNSLDFNFKLPKGFKYNMHLMVKDPEIWIKKRWKEIELFIPQLEEVKDIPKYIQWMKKSKKKVAFALKPETSVREIKPYLKDVDYVLILTVHPGFYGSKFIPSTLKKISLIKKANQKLKVIVDGGMCPEKIGLAAKAGADYFVSGSYTTKAGKPRESIRKLMLAIRKNKKRS
jgi:ribulose-phosphate 3-epimerase